MADLLTHGGTNLLLGTALDQHARGGLLIGAFLPDLLAVIGGILFTGNVWYVAPFHSLTGIILTSILMGLAFDRKIRTSIIVFIFLGQCIHIGMDYAAVSYIQVMELLYPLPVELPRINLWRDSQMIYLGPVLLVLVVIIYQKSIQWFLLNIIQHVEDWWGN